MKKLTVALLAVLLTLSFCACGILPAVPTEPTEPPVPAECTVTFDLNGGVAGEGFEETVTVNRGRTVPMVSPTKENFAFTGWFDGETLYTAETPIEKDVTLVAQWSFANTYTLTFETNGMAEVPAMHPIIGELPAIPATPVVEGYVFAGWYFDAELTSRYFFDYPLSEETTLYAKFYDTALGEYIVISNVEQLTAIREDPAAKYLLACNINCKGETLVPIDEFTGELDGNGYKIYNYTMNENALNVAFIRTNTGVVKNLSFGDFTYDVLRNSSSNKFYGVICGINQGTIENCAVLDGEIFLSCDGSGSDYDLYAGGIVGANYGTVVGCRNNAVLNVNTVHNGYGSYNYNRRSNSLWIPAGGIAGMNFEGAVISGCANTGDLHFTGVANYTGNGGYVYYYAGGIAGKNEGSVDASGSVCNITVGCTGHHAQVFTGGAVGYNTREIKNASARGNMVIDNAAGKTDVRLGGFVGYNCGKLYNCYSAMDISCNCANIKAIGGFAGHNEKLAGKEYVIHKSFSVGSISVSGTAENAGKFIGLSTGTERDCVYLDTVTVTQPTVEDGEETTVDVTLTNSIGAAMAETDLLSVDFLENTLYFDRMVWFLVDGKLPELR